jgi:hypothetical protein
LVDGVHQDLKPTGDVLVPHCAFDVFILAHCLQNITQFTGRAAYQPHYVRCSRVAVEDRAAESTPVPTRLAEEGEDTPLQEGWQHVRWAVIEAADFLKLRQKRSVQFVLLPVEPGLVQSPQ